MKQSDDLRLGFAKKIEQIASIKSAALVRAFAAVPREAYVGPGPWMIFHLAQMKKGYQLTPDDDPRHIYDTVLVALDETRLLNNGDPTNVARLLDCLDLAPGMSVLQIGCGTGYYTAMAAEIVGSSGCVVAVEIDTLLAARARANLERYPNVRVIAGDGTALTDGTYDAIFANAGCTHPPAQWLDSLSPGGRLAIPLTRNLALPEIGAGFLLLVTYTDDGYAARFHSRVGFIHCTGARDAETEARLQAAIDGGNHEKVRRLRRDRHEKSGDCWLHADAVCLSF